MKAVLRIILLSGAVGFLAPFDKLIAQSCAPGGTAGCSECIDCCKGVRSREKELCKSEPDGFFEEKCKDLADKDFTDCDLDCRSEKNDCPDNPDQKFYDTGGCYPYTNVGGCPWWY